MEKIRPIYSELQGYLAQAPGADKGMIFEKSIWEGYHATIDELNAVTGDNYDRYKVQVQPWASSDIGFALSILEYRTKIGGLIARLHGSFFSNEAAPFSGMPNTVITNQQTQSQTVNVQMLLEVQSKIDEVLPTLPEGSKEKGFLERIKSSLGQTKNISELIRLILQTGNDMGITLVQMLKWFG